MKLPVVSTTDDIEERVEEYNQRVCGGTMSAHNKNMYRRLCREWDNDAAREEMPQSNRLLDGE